MCDDEIKLVEMCREKKLTDKRRKTPPTTIKSETSDEEACGRNDAKRKA